MAGIMVGHAAFTWQRVGGKWKEGVGGEIGLCFSRDCRPCRPSTVWDGRWVHASIETSQGQPCCHPGGEGMVDQHFFTFPAYLRLKLYTHVHFSNPETPLLRRGNAS